MSHICKNLLIRCMDFRLNDEVERWTKESELFEGGFDIVSVAGASKSLAGENSDMIKSFLGNVAVSVGTMQKELLFFIIAIVGRMRRIINLIPEKKKKRSNLKT